MTTCDENIKTTTNLKKLKIKKSKIKKTQKTKIKKLSAKLTKTN